MSKCYNCKEIGGCIPSEASYYDCFYCGYQGCRRQELYERVFLINIIFRLGVFIYTLFMLTVVVNSGNRFDINDFFGAILLLIISVASLGIFIGQDIKRES